MGQDQGAPPGQPPGQNAGAKARVQHLRLRLCGNDRFNHLQHGIVAGKRILAVSLSLGDSLIILRRPLIKAFFI